MALFPLGILSAAGAGGAAGATFELINTQIVSGSSTSTITFDVSSFASTYRHLQIRAAVKTAFTGSWADGLAMRFNSDSGSNYNSHDIFGSQLGSVESGSSGSTTSIASILITGSVTTNLFSGNVIDILDAFSTTKNTTVRAMSGVTSTGSQIRLTSGLWRNTASITTIDLSSANAVTFIAGSRFSIYGIRG
jgi:hypothetical protein